MIKIFSVATLLSGFAAAIFLFRDSPIHIFDICCITINAFFCGATISR